MRVLIAPHHLGSIFTPDVVAQALAKGWQRSRPDDDVFTHPHSDGSMGFLEVVPGQAEVLTITVQQQPYPIQVVRHAKDKNLWHTVYCHTDSFMSEEPCDEAALDRASSAPVGEMLSQLLDRGAKRIVIGTGHAPWHDGGAGALAQLAKSLGLEPFDGEERLADGRINPAIASIFNAVREQLRSVSIVVASSREVPLRGLHGAGAELAEYHAVSASAAQRIESRGADFVNAIDALVKAAAADSLLGTDSATLLSRRNYAGAAGGAAFMLVALGATIYPGSWVTGEETGLNAALDRADLVVTGAEVVAGEELGDGVVADVARRATTRALPVIVVGVRVDASRRQLSKIGVQGAYPVIDTPSGRPQITARAITETDLIARGERLAKTWSR